MSPGHVADNKGLQPVRGPGISEQWYKEELFRPVAT